MPKIKHFDSYKEVAQHILAMDDKLCNEIFLINLITYAPSRDDNLVLMQKYLDGPEEDCLKLDQPEQFTIEMMRMYRYESRLKFMLFRVQFWDKFEQLKQSLSVVLSASDALRNSDAFRDLLHVILLLGNYMNASSIQGGAFGMRIDSINKLTDTKASDSSQLTLLHVLIGIVRREFPHILNFTQDLKDVTEAARVMASIADIVQQYTEMRQGLKHLGVELESYWKEQHQDDKHDRFFTVMEEYRTSATGRFEELEALYVNVDAKWKDAMVYYGENPRNKRPDEFFNIFARFLSSWKTSAIEEANYTRQQELAEKRRKEIEERRAKALKIMDSDSIQSEDSESTSGDDDRRLMDDLLEKLRSGEKENKSRQLRVRQRLKRLRNAQSPSIKMERKLSHRSNSISSTASSGHMPLISAEDMLRNLQQEDE
ncbi:hypothetical protein G6F42_021530 [Rhizopus arrhizus]|nr:hypothetical protein G6F42_021530 [Rhizopus arrhizus]